MWIALWIVFAIVVGAIAGGKGRSVIGWTLLALLISPLLAGILLIAAGQGQGGMKRCGACAELVKAEARVCKHCGRDFATPLPAKAPGPRPAGIARLDGVRPLAALPDDPPAAVRGGYVALTRDGRRVELGADGRDPHDRPS